MSACDKCSHNKCSHEYEELPSYTDITAKIEKYDEHISYLVHLYRKTKEDLHKLDDEIMCEYKKKWLLERRLVKITKCKPGSAIKKHTPQVQVQELSKEDAARLLELLKPISK